MVMTNAEKFKQGIVVYKNDDGIYTLEIWGASTKRADCIFTMENYEFPFFLDKNNEEDVEYEVFQWLLECARRIVDYALENWYERG